MKKKILLFTFVTLLFYSILNGLFYLSFQVFDKIELSQKMVLLPQLTTYVIFFFICFIFYRIFRDKNVIKKRKIKPILLIISFFLVLCYIALVYKSISQVQFSFYPFISILIGIIILEPISEELIFRGLIFNFLQKSNKLFLSLLISSFLFSIAHLNPFEIDWFYLIYTFIIGLFLGLIYYKFGLINSIISHIFMNLIIYLNKFKIIDFNSLFNIDSIIVLSSLLISFLVIFLFVFKFINNFGSQEN